MSLELRNRLEQGLGLRLQATLVFAYPNLDALTAHLMERLNLAGEPGPVEEARGVLAPAAEVVPPAAGGDPGDDLLTRFDESVRRRKEAGTAAPAPPAGSVGDDDLLTTFDQSMRRLKDKRKP